MGRPPCCDKVGIKKGPWTPEEDIILVSYIQEHGPGNWRSVPTNTGLSRCSKSCRLRWTNYLRPGIKRGNFTPHEEGMIIHLQALLGNKWAAIASYLPQRTDNDIKNYWNTHLKKKLKKFQAASMDPSSDSTTNNTTTGQYLSSNKCFNDRRTNLDTSIINKNNNNASISSSQNNNRLNNQSQSQSSSSTTYASSTENISRLLEGWMRTSPKAQQQQQLKRTTQEQSEIHQGFEQNKIVKSVSLPVLNLQLQNRTKDENEQDNGVGHEEFDSILSFENLNSAAWDKSTCDSMPEKSSEGGADEKGHHHHHDHDDDHHHGAEKSYRQKNENSNNNNNGAPPLSFLEKWLLDENVGQGEEMMELSPMF